ncbi:hypothetical protein E3N88_02013 [Mikania micrantha]|uniref:RNase H type-1 domain-containing protein n=1 Tax=Mikania micrantha TaxID=192012 RepID=A0A5N6Q4H4_9ASTR|nr:hypothetical protein E3N88_02013 [Mikania micrantha]
MLFILTLNSQQSRIRPGVKNPENRFRNQRVQFGRTRQIIHRSKTLLLPPSLSRRGTPPYSAAGVIYQPKAKGRTSGNYAARCFSNGAFSLSLRRRIDHHAAIITTENGLVLTRFRASCFSTRKTGGGKSKTKNSDSKSGKMLGDEKNAFFVVRKGDLVGVYKNLNDCQAQVGSSVCDPPVSVYKGYTMPREAEEYMISCGLKNALYSIKATDLTEELFGNLVACPFQQPHFALGEPSADHLSKRRFQEVLGSQTGEGFGLTPMSADPARKHAKLENLATQALTTHRTCILEFDGASKGNPGQAGAGAVLRTNDGNLICRLREGLGIATNNVAEYRAIILGLRYALSKGFTSIRVLGDSKLVCMQVQGLWKVKNQNISKLYEEAKKLKDKFVCFQIDHVLRLVRFRKLTHNARHNKA